MHRAATYVITLLLVSMVLPLSPPVQATYRASDNPNLPQNPVRLIFIHHSTGENWLADDNGGLGVALRDNNYYVSDTNYGWGPDSIGDHTDIGHWWLWFRGPSSATYMTALYAESGQHSAYSRMDTNPGGENEIIMFKSCFPNSALKGDPSDPVPPISSNPLRGEDSSSDHHTVANAKGIYIDLLEYFRTHQNKLFIVITAPPLSDPTYSSNARAFNEWLTHDWLLSYSHKNVFVFDFYNVLTTNGGDPSTNDLNQETGNHHRWWHNAIQHKTDGDNDPNPNVLEYPTGDDHPSRAGNLKATAEFLPLLNIAYSLWKTTVTASYSLVGGGSPAAPTFNYVQNGTSQNYTLAATPYSISVDPGSGWSVTPNPLLGSTSLERWWTSQPTNGNATSSQTIVFSYQHQYNLTMQANPSSGGTVAPASGWQRAGLSVSVQATANLGYVFSSWNGTGLGSFTGVDSPATTTMNGGIVETANFQPLPGIHLSMGWNLISLPLVPKDAAIATVLRYQIASNKVAVAWSYAGTPRAWRYFIPGKPSTLTTMVDGDAYWIYMRSPDTLYVDGYVIAPTKAPPSYSLVAGWNLVGFKPQPILTNETVGAYLSSIAGRYDVNSVWLYDNSNGVWIQAPSSTILHPGNALWVRTTAAATLYPE